MCRMIVSHTASVAAWLIDGAPSAKLAENVLTEMCQRLLACGVPLWRVSVFVRTLHPEVLGRQFRWLAGEGTLVSDAPFARENDDDFRLSPVLRIHATRVPIRRRLCDRECPDDFSILGEFRAQGATDYFAAPLIFSNGEVHVATWITRNEGGFTDAQIAGIETILAPLARVAEVRALRRTAVNLLDAYVGHEAGERILSGRIKRGDTESIRAAIWLSDMRGFTELADSIAPRELIALLNRFFDCQVPAIQEHGGEVLKFMGDGLLAIFRIGDDAEASAATCRRALAAARKVRSELVAMQQAAQSGPSIPVRFGLALHLGEALYGNIGGGGRLDFTCIGPAVNLAARLEKLASRLGRRIICSSAFADHLPDEMVALGEFELRGFRAVETAYGLRDDVVG
jgi:adenylate cyclase